MDETPPSRNAGLVTNASRAWKGAAAGSSANAQDTRNRPDASHTFQSKNPVSISIDDSPCPRFDVEDPAMLKHLEEHGYVVVREVANMEQTQIAQ